MHELRADAAATIARRHSLPSRLRSILLPARLTRHRAGKHDRKIEATRTL